MKTTIMTFLTVSLLIIQLKYRHQDRLLYSLVLGSGSNYLSRYLDQKTAKEPLRSSSQVST